VRAKSILWDRAKTRCAAAEEEVLGQAEAKGASANDDDVEGPTIGRLIERVADVIPEDVARELGGGCWRYHAE
jgi:hypothetical protein